MLWHYWLGGRKGTRPVKKWGWWRWALVSPIGVVPCRMVCVSASVNLPLYHKVQKFSSGTGSPGWSLKKGRKTVVVWWWFIPWGSCKVSQWACLYVCLSVHLHVSKTTQPDFTKFSVCVTCGCGSVLVWRPCSMLCTSGFANVSTYQPTFHPSRRQMHWSAVGAVEALCTVHFYSARGRHVHSPPRGLMGQSLSLIAFW